MFRKVLVANRGEIAVRVIRALREMRIRPVAVYSDADRPALHVRMADEAAHIGPPAASESYLRIERIIDAARKHGAEAIHPGYGFLSENAEFAEACAASGLVFIGPPAPAIRAMGSKTAARRLAIAADVPVVPGTETAVSGIDEARREASRCGYPVMLKAAAGGGGKGMRRVDDERSLEAALRDASSEAERSFKSGEVYIEKLIENPRHIEIQVFGDRYGNLIHLGERECSIQRRHQKIIEESPSPLVAAYPAMREAMGTAAVRAARAAGYSNAGTVEFLVDSERNFYFLEMNTRLQVEHPVTELTTGLDLVQMQLRVAAGEPLGLEQSGIQWRGSAIECRLYAEDPGNHFFPSPGRISRVVEPAGPGIRLDSGVYAGYTVPIDYDPLLAKLAAWAGSRQEAIERLGRALDETVLDGIRTNTSYLRRILDDPGFRAGRLHTGFLTGFGGRTGAEPPASEIEVTVAALAAALDGSQRGPTDNGRAELSRWLSEGRDRTMR